jgi:hypothetical protein
MCVCLCARARCSSDAALSPLHLCTLYVHLAQSSVDEILLLPAPHHCKNSTLLAALPVIFSLCECLIFYSFMGILMGFGEEVGINTHV